MLHAKISPKIIEIDRCVMDLVKKQKWLRFLETWCEILVKSN